MSGRSFLMSGVGFLGAALMLPGAAAADSVCLSDRYIAERNAIFKLAFAERTTGRATILRKIPAYSEAEQADRAGLIALVEMREGRAPTHNEDQISSPLEPEPGCGPTPSVGSVAQRMADIGQRSSPQYVAEMQQLLRWLSKSQDPAAVVFNSEAIIILAEAWLDQNKLDDAERFAKLALAALRESQVAQGAMAARALWVLASVEASRGAWPAAAGLWRALIGLERIDDDVRVVAAGRLGEVITRMDACGEPLNVFDKAVTELSTSHTKIGFSALATMGYQLGRAMMRCDMPGPATFRLEQALRWLDISVAPWDYRRGRILVTLAELETADKRLDAAEALLARAETIARAKGSKPAEARVLASEIVVARADLAFSAKAYGAAAEASREILTNVAGDDVAVQRWAFVRWARSLLALERRAAALDAIRSASARAYRDADPIDSEHLLLEATYLDLAWTAFRVDPSPAMGERQ